MANFDPAKTRLRYGLAHASERGEPRFASGTIHQPRPAELGIAATREPIVSNAIAANGKRQKSRAGTISATWAPVLELDPHACALVFALAGGYVTTTTLETGVYEHVISQTSGTTDFTSRRAIGQAHLQDADTVGTVPGVTIGGWVVGIETDTLVTLTPKGAGSSYDNWGPATRTAGTGTSPVPYLRGAQLKARAETDLDIQVDVTVPSATAGFDADFLIYDVGDTPGATVVPIKAGVWTEVYLSDGTTPGLGPADVEIYLPSATDLDDGDTFVFHRVYRTADLWATALPDPSGMSSLYAAVYLDGVKLGAAADSKATSIEVDFGVEPTNLVGIGGAFGKTVSRGVKGGDITISREYLDEGQRRRLASGESVHLKLVMETPETIASSDVRHSVTIICPSCSASGDFPLPTSPEEWPEEITLSAEEADEADADGFSDPVTVVIVNGASAIA